MSDTILVRCESCGIENRVPRSRLGGSARPVCGKCKETLHLGSGKVWDVRDAEFERRVINSGIPVLLDCWAPWCGPCRAVAPILDRIAARHGHALHVVRLNVDDNPLTAARYRINSIPTLLLIRNGSVLHRHVGAVPEHEIEGSLKRFGIA